MQWWCSAQGVEWTWAWQAYPGVWLFVGLLLLGYWPLHRRMAAEGEERGRRRGTAYLAGVAVLWLALDWPVGALGAGYLASVHMIQFLMIALVAPPLLLLGIPAPSYRRVAGWAPESVFRWLTHPLVTLALFTIVLAGSHWPPVVDGLMPTQVGSLLLDLTWLAAGIVFWWPVVAPVPVRTGWAYPAKIGYLIGATLVNTGTFAYLTFTDLPLYATYELAPPFPGISTRDDQTVAGLLMKMGGAAVLWTAITVLFARWYVTSERGGATGDQGSATAS